MHPTGQRQHVHATIQAADDTQTRCGVVEGMAIAPGPADTSHLAGDNGLPLHMLLLLLMMLLMMMRPAVNIVNVVVVAMTITTTTTSMNIATAIVGAIHRHKDVVVTVVTVDVLLQ